MEDIDPGKGLVLIATFEAIGDAYIVAEQLTKLLNRLHQVVDRNGEAFSVRPEYFKP